jgi:hypothetical protein
VQAAAVAGEETDRGERINGGGDRLIVACQSKGEEGAMRLGGLRGRPWRAAPASLLARRGQRRGGAGPGGPGRARGSGVAQGIAAGRQPKEDERGGKRREKEKGKENEKEKKENRKRKIRAEKNRKEI